MDPLTALSVASSVVQLIQFGCSLTSMAKRVYDSADGALPEHITCVATSQRLTDLCTSVKQSITGVGNKGNQARDSSMDALEEICNGCVEVSGELQVILAKLRLESLPESRTRRKWRSLREAIRGVFSEHDIGRLTSKLSSLRDELELHIVFQIRDQTALMADEHRQTYIALQNSVKSLVDRPVVQEKDLLDTTSVIVRQNEEQHEQTRRTILAAMSQTDAHKVQEMMLQSLRFSEMRDRHQEIPEAHVQTLKWIFEDFGPAEFSKPRNGFVDWLRTGSNFYWVNGKAGSGKSTLMRYVVDDPRLLNNLKMWSGNTDLDVAAFFFWNSGSTEQRSYVGLLRSLLFEVLKKKMDILPAVFPDEWEDYCSSLERSRAIGGNWELDDRTWRLPTLKQAFSRLTDFDISPSNKCFFIDGLDEYDGDHEAMLDFLRTVTRSPHVKICFSSRPWLVFEDLFKDSPGIRLQDLTHHDIQLYVSHELESNIKMRDLAKQRPDHAAELVNEIVSKASGVFLWVKLAVKNLLSGLRNRDSISDLRARLRALPAELEGMYAHMLSQIEPAYRSQAFRTFEIYNAMSKQMESVCALELEAAITADFQSTMDLSLTDMAADEVKRRNDNIEAHLKSRCAGLLEVRTVLDSSVYELNLTSHREQHWETKKVTYLHQTARDFLEANVSVHFSLQLGPEEINFRPYWQIFTSFVARLKQNLVRKIDSVCVWIDNLHLALQFARLCDDINDCKLTVLLDELDRTATIHGIDELRVSKAAYDHWSDIGPRCKSIEQQGSGFTGEAVYYGILSYASAKLNSNHARLITCKQANQALLNCVLLPKPNVERDFQCTQGVDLMMLELLLSHGADPNQLWNGHTPWQRVLTLVHEFDWVNIVLGVSCVNSTYLDDVLLNWVGAFKLLLRYGASITTTCMRNHSKDHLVSCTRDMAFSHSVMDVIMDVFFHQLPEEALDLQRMASKSAAAGNLKRNEPSKDCKPSKNCKSSGGQKRMLQAEPEILSKRICY
ncbi:hypothetical protein BKA64DRAFT_226606 [Cadophora sp. MPI-SDFR-AT-0126]|nr:hypothetical protein BKA64DRAFT_226606 [Leotiomycetes sp. MPI-SDFR-AT-0126]